MHAIIATADKKKDKIIDVVCIQRRSFFFLKMLVLLEVTQKYQKIV